MSVPRDPLCDYLCMLTESQRTDCGEHLNCLKNSLFECFLHCCSTFFFLTLICVETSYGNFEFDRWSWREFPFDFFDFDIPRQIFCVLNSVRIWMPLQSWPPFVGGRVPLIECYFWDPSFILNQALSRHSPPKTPAHHRRERKRKRGDGEEEEVVGSWSWMICWWNRKCHLWQVRWIKNRAAFIDVSGSLKFSERRWAGKRENHCQEQSSIPKIMKRNGCRGRSTQDDECTERRLSICLSVNLFSCLLLVCLCAHVLVSLCMCVILFRLNANSRSQIKKIVLEQYSIIDFSCVLPVGWHPYYTDKWSKSQDCVSTIKPLRGTDLPPKHRNSGGMWRDMPWKCFPGCSESPEGV